MDKFPLVAPNHGGTRLFFFVLHIKSPDFYSFPSWIGEITENRLKLIVLLLLLPMQCCRRNSRGLSTANKKPYCSIRRPFKNDTYFYHVELVLSNWRYIVYYTRDAKLGDKCFVERRRLGIDRNYFQLAMKCITSTKQVLFFVILPKYRMCLRWTTYTVRIVDWKIEKLRLGESTKS